MPLALFDHLGWWMSSGPHGQPQEPRRACSTDAAVRAVVAFIYVNNSRGLVSIRRFGAPPCVCVACETFSPLWTIAVDVSVNVAILELVYLTYS